MSRSSISVVTASCTFRCAISDIFDAMRRTADFFSTNSISTLKIGNENYFQSFCARFKKIQICMPPAENSKNLNANLLTRISQAAEVDKCDILNDQHSYSRVMCYAIERRRVWVGPNGDWSDFHFDQSPLGHTDTPSFHSVTHKSYTNKLRGNSISLRFE